MQLKYYRRFFVLRSVVSSEHERGFQTDSLYRKRLNDIKQSSTRSEISKRISFRNVSVNTQTLSTRGYAQ